MKYYNDVKAFHDKFGLVTPDSYFQIPTDLYEFRVKFFEEEFHEYVESFETRDLGTAIDSLIDLVYITCGAALLHGFKPDIFNSPNMLSAFGDPQDRQTSRIERPHFLSMEDHHRFRTSIRRCIELYRIAYIRNDEAGIAQTFNGIFWSCIQAAEMMSFYQKRWDALWDDVQRANMSKERAVSKDQSKRGSTWDVFKPEGWIGPRTEEMVNKMIAGEL